MSLIQIDFLRDYRFRYKLLILLEIIRMLFLMYLFI